MYRAATGGGSAWWLLWPAASFLVVATAYLVPCRIGPRVFGKREDGTRAAWAVVVLLPYFVLSWLAWYASRRLTRSHVYDEVSPGVFLGRRPYCRELPAGVATVIDLTAEFPAARSIADGRRYVCVPTLDRMATPAEAMARLVDAAAEWPGMIYVHCASGHGRSAAVVVALLVARGLARDAAAAEEIVRRARPNVMLSSSQRAAVERVLRDRVGRS